MDDVPRSWKSHERRSLYFPATHVLRKTCIRMENPRNLIERVRESGASSAREFSQKSISTGKYRR